MAHAAPMAKRRRRGRLPQREGRYQRQRDDDAHHHHPDPEGRGFLTPQHPDRRIAAAALL
jgi:hypothetical protein